LLETRWCWGGEFGRTNYSQGKLTKDDYGRDHHPRCFSVWMAKSGVRPGLVFGQTCEFGYNVVQDPVHVHDFHATLLHLLGIDHERLTYKYQGRRFRLTEFMGVIRPLLASRARHSDGEMNRRHFLSRAAGAGAIWAEAPAGQVGLFATETSGGVAQAVDCELAIRGRAGVRGGASCVGSGLRVPLTGRRIGSEVN
jgi:hypothetical protein